MILNRLFELIPKRLRNKIITWLKNNYIKTEFNYKLSIDEIDEFRNKTVLITGSTGSIGTALCLAFASRGAIVAVASRNESRIKRTIDYLLSINKDFVLIPIVIDVTDDTSIQKGIEKFSEMNGGRVDVLINNAGGSERLNKAPLKDLSVEVIDDVLNTNLRGSIMCSKFALKFMSKGGRIINMSSVMGICGAPDRTSYCASKSAIIGFTKSLALEVGKFGITVNSISPGQVLQSQMDRLTSGETPTIGNAIGRWGYADEVASLAVYLSSDKGSYITGQNIPVDGGRSLGLK